MQQRLQDPFLRLLDRYQRDFPLQSAPFALLAAECGLPESVLLLRLQQARDDGLISRIGAVFAPNTVGASTLAALAVPPARLDEVAALVSSLPQVNHNYARDHHYNLWFVLAAPDRAGIVAALARIAELTGLVPLDLPLEREYHIDLGFALGEQGPSRRVTVSPPPPALDEADRRLISALGDGLPLLPCPFLPLAAASGLAEQAVRERLQDWETSGVVRRFGFVLRHHELGFRGNAMCVWQVPAAARDDIGARLAGDAAVSLCYARPPLGPHWPYNLFCMIHTRDADSARREVRRLAEEHLLLHVPQAMLLSTRRYTQRGARYHQETT
ncbi:Lrp/AsnC family transcriptional regulator [Vogesella sp. LIG4]|uniref:siroheme decarboxylase subunit beta n=1 Tax=Vogesella sp. LIG4 TaxID=1192162 RepID=UPI000820156D|nr:Lrp/AsnC family transcriptional regulator [Vogesella sp. LIG4]SCK19354.1 DNA-binding transcriptional regulator, Lrp family [Vogesella sp. LIG4]